MVSRRDAMDAEEYMINHKGTKDTKKNWIYIHNFLPLCSSCLSGSNCFSPASSAPLRETAFYLNS